MGSSQRLMNEEQTHRESQETIRFAAAADARDLARLRYLFRSGLEAAWDDEAVFVDRCRVWMEERVQEGSAWRCWIAEQNRVVVGNLWMQLIEKIPNPVIEPARHAYIT